MDCSIASGAAEAFPGGQAGMAQFAAGTAGQFPGGGGLDRIQVALVGGRRFLQVDQLAVGEGPVVGTAGAETGHRVRGGQERVCDVFHNTNFRTIARLFEKKVPNVDNFSLLRGEEGSVSLWHKASPAVVVVT